MKTDITRCRYPDCTNPASSKGKRGKESPVLQAGGDQQKRFPWCNYHRKGKGKAERQAYALQLREGETV